MKKWMLGLIGMVAVILYVWIAVLGHDPLQPAIASKILRFHVIANSDDERDQKVKEKVRDAVGNYLSPYLLEVTDIEETKAVVNEHLEQIIEVAEETLMEHGFSYPVTAQVADAEFPEKSYGSYRFPAGQYQALQIVIGEGKGQNWWCVLYPNMCFRGTVYEVVEEEAKEALKEILSPWEYADVFDSGKVKLRFKFLEYFTKTE